LRFGAEDGLTFEPIAVGVLVIHRGSSHDGRVVCVLASIERMLRKGKIRLPDVVS
jgi:hypothetical protein